MTRVAGKPFEIDINNGFNPSRFKSIGNQSAINLFEFEDAMLPTAGFSSLFDNLGGNVEGRGIFYSDSVGKCIGVIGNSVYTITDEHYTLVGTLATLKGRVYFAENGLTNQPDVGTGLLGGQVAISDGLNVYVYGVDGTFAIAINDAGDPVPFTPGTISFQNSFFFINDLNSNQVYASALNNAFIFPSLSFTTISEQTVSTLAFKNLLYIFGFDKTFIFYDNAQEFFPYSQDVNRAWEFGNYAQGSLAASIGKMAWLGSSRQGNPTILASTGGNPKPISTMGIDSIIDGLLDQQDCDGFMFQEDGHEFYQITFNTDNLSLLFDFTTNKWSKLTSDNGIDANPILQTAYYKDKNKLLGIRRDTGEFTEVSLKIFTQAEKIVPRTIITNNYSNGERAYIIKEIDLEIEQGENQNTSKICLSISKDRGRTYPINQVVELQKIGNRQALLRFRRMGYARWWTFKFDFFSQDRFVILSATGYLQK